jgi:thiopeptide-type bacteriocin biosynthesis protein
MMARQGTWCAAHVFLSDPRKAERFLLKVVQPRMPRANEGAWFFMRYWEGGPHMRIRWTHDGHAPLDEMRAGFIAAIDEYLHHAPPDRERFYRDNKFDGGPQNIESLPWFAEGSVVDLPYLPEFRRYGGESAMAANENLFHASSVLAAKLLAATADRGDVRSSLAMELMTAGAAALGCDRKSAAHYFQNYQKQWERFYDGKGVPTPSDEEQAKLRERFTAFGEADMGPGSIWWRAVRNLMAELRSLGGQGRLFMPHDGTPVATDNHLQRALGSILASQTHMLNNRLGINPGQEYRLARLAELALA